VESESRRRGSQVGQQRSGFDVENVHLEVLGNAAVVTLGAIDFK
jgi:hypothetical protein